MNPLDFLAVLLPLLCFAALLQGDNFRESFLNSALATGLFVFSSTEILSLFKAVAFRPVLACWTLYLAALIFRRYRNGFALPKVALAETTWYQKALLSLTAIIVAITGVTAVVAAPNNFDSLTYHLPRVMHWIQNRSVAHYPTIVDRQLLLAPFSEYMIMHLQLLSGSDRFANCVQWFAMVGSAVGVSLIARSLKGSVNSQIAAAAVAVSLPMGLLQSTSTQNDYTVTFWLVCLAYFVLGTKEEGGAGNALRVGAALALAIFTKGTAYFIAGPIMLLYLWHLVPHGVKGAAKSAAIVAVAVLVVNAPFLARNYQTFHNPLSPGTGNDIICKRIDAASVISCLTRNIASQLATGVESADPALLKVTRAVHSAIGVDLNDPQLTANDDFYILPPLVKYHEDYAPNPLHMMLLFAAALVLAIRWRNVSREAVLLAAAMASAFVALSMALKWTPYLSRYFIAVFVISAPAVAVLFDAARARLALSVCALLLLASSFFVIGNNQMRPLVGPQSVFVTDRTQQYFKARPLAVGYFTAVANMVKAQPNRNIGINGAHGNILEYLLWVVLRDGSGTYRIEHVGVRNPSGQIELKDFTNYFPVSI